MWYFINVFNLIYLVCFFFFDKRLKVLVKNECLIVSGGVIGKFVCRKVNFIKVLSNIEKLI